MKEPQWQTGDLLDLDYLLQRDRDDRAADDSMLAIRDRTIYQEVASSLPEDRKHPKDRSLLRCWLESRRRQLSRSRTEKMLPGRVWNEISSLALWLSIGIGVLAGVSVCVPYFSYTGSAPLNVTVYFAVFVVLQLLLTGVQGLVLGLNILRGMRPPKSILAGLTGRMVMKLAQTVSRRLLREDGSSLALLTKGVQRLQQRKGYAPLSLWSAFLLLQLVAVGFNLGIIATTLTKVAVADIAFGWQSTLQVQEQVLAEAVQWIALPWSWCIPEHMAFPDLEAIAGSRIILKDGIRNLYTENLVTWWPFLCLSVFFYGLLPRMGLLLFGAYRRSRELKGLPIIDLDVAAVLRRMKTATLDVGSRSVVEERTVPEKASASPQEERADDTAPPEPVGKAAVILIPAELEEMCSSEELKQQIDGGKLGGEYAFSMYSFGDLDGTEQEVMGTIQRIADSSSVVRMYILQEGWQPPIEESLGLLRNIRSAVGSETSITMILVGKPRPETIFTPATEEQLRIWRMKFEAVNDPNLEIRSC